MTLTITETTSNNRTKSKILLQNLNPLGKNINPKSPPPPKKIATLPKNISIPLNILNPPEISQSFLKVSQLS